MPRGSVLIRLGPPQRCIQCKKSSDFRSFAPHKGALAKSAVRVLGDSNRALSLAFVLLIALESGP